MSSTHCTAGICPSILSFDNRIHRTRTRSLGISCVFSPLWGVSTVVCFLRLYYSSNGAVWQRYGKKKVEERWGGLFWKVCGIALYVFVHEIVTSDLRRTVAFLLKYGLIILKRLDSYQIQMEENTTRYFNGDRFDLCRIRFLCIFQLWRWRIKIVNLGA